MKKNRVGLYIPHGCARKFLLPMKLMLFLTLFSCFSAFAGSYAQNTKLNLKFEDRQIKDILNEIEDQTKFSFMYDNRQVDVERKVNLDVRDENIDQVLDALFAGTNITYKVIERHIMLMPGNAPVVARQPGKVNGTVTDEKGQPLPGVTIVVKGTSNGIVTDMDGKFSLSKVGADDVLVFSFIGMKTQEIPVGSQTDFKIVMADETIGVDEVVVVGFGIQKKVNLTGAVGTIDSEALESRPVQNASQMLQGMAPGLNITQSSGSLESTPTINIRGKTTIGTGSSGDPLVLIDGMEGDINAINPQDIESISILKDAAASSIYGSRAPFGVILVTTKKGKDGRTTVNYNNSFRWNIPINMPDMMDSYTFALFFNDAEVDGGSSPFFDDDHLSRILAYQKGELKSSIPVSSSNSQYWADGYADGNDNIDWYKAMYRANSFAQEHNLSVTGGSQKLQYYFSGNFLDQNGLMEFNQDKFQRYTTTLKITAQLSDWASLTLNNRFIRQDYGRPSRLSDSFFTDLARQGWPTLPLYDPNGYLYSSPSPALGMRDGGRDKNQKDWHYQQFQLVLEPVKGWKTFAEFNYRINDNFRHWDIQKTYNHDVNGNPYEYNSSSQVYEYSYRENFLSTNIYSEYRTQLGEGHNIKGMLGFQAERERYRDVSATSYGIIVESVPVLNATSGISNGKRSNLSCPVNIRVGKHAVFLAV